MQELADLYPGNHIHQTAIIDPSVSLGIGNYIGPYTVIGPDVRIGDRNRIEGQCSIGQPAEHVHYFTGHWAKGVVIGSDNVIREFTTINSGTEIVTQMGNYCIMLRGSHLSHDSVIEDKVTLSCNVLLGGHSYVMEGANLGLGAITHQRSIIGAYTLVGMGAVVTKKVQVKPGSIYVGNPARWLKMNDVGLKRNGVTDERLRELADRFWKLVLKE